MKSKIIFVILSIVFCYSQNKLYGQPQLWDIYTISNQPYINVTVDKYESDSLYLKSMNQLYALHQDSIKYLIKKRDANFGLGFLFGAVAGGIFGGVSSSGSGGIFSRIGKDLSIAICAIIGGALGGAVGLASGSDEKYKIEKLNNEDKRKLLNNLFH